MILESLQRSTSPGRWLSMAVLIGGMAGAGIAVATDCVVHAELMSDVDAAQRQAEKLRAIQTRAVDTPFVFGTAARSDPSPQRITRADLRARTRQAMMAGPSTGGLIAAEARSSAAGVAKHEVEVEGGKYSVTTVPGATREAAAAAVSRSLEIERKLGPERNVLLLAADASDLRALRAAVERGAPVNDVRDRAGRQVDLVGRVIARWYADEYDEQVRRADELVAIVKLLLAHGAPAQVPGGPDGLAIIANRDPGDPNPPAANDLAGLLVRSGASLQPQGAIWPLSDFAAARGDIALLDVMLRDGKPTQFDKDSALVAAVQNGKFAAALLALEAGADPDAQGKAHKRFDRPVIDSVMSGGAPRELITAMIRHRFNPNVEIMGGVTPLMRVVHDHALMREFLALGADPNAVSRWQGQTALHLATEFVWDPPSGYAPKYYSPQIRARSVEILLGARADPNVRDTRGFTPLMQTTADDAGAIRALVAAGGTVNATIDPRGYVASADYPIGPVSWALSAGNPTLATELARRKGRLEAADCGAAFYAAAAGAVPTLLALIERGEPLDAAIDDAGRTPLIAAAAAGHVATVAILLERNLARIDEGTTMAPRLRKHITDQLARMGPGRVDGTEATDARRRLLVESMIRAQFVQGVTPLMAAAGRGRADVVRWLLQRNARVDMRDDAGRSALDHALAERPEPNREVLELLRGTGARQGLR